LASVSSDYMCHHNSNIQIKLAAFHCHYESTTRNQGCQPVCTKTARPCLKKPKINQKAVLRHLNYTYNIKTCITKQKWILKLIRNIDIMQLQFLEAFSYPINTLSYICFLLNISINFRTTVKSLQYSLQPA